MQEYYLDSRQGIKSLGFVFGLRALDGKDRVPLLSEQRSPMTGYPVVALLEGIAGRRERRCEGGSVSFSTIYSPRVKSRALVLTQYSTRISWHLVLMLVLLVKSSRLALQRARYLPLHLAVNTAEYLNLFLALA